MFQIVENMLLKICENIKFIHLMSRTFIPKLIQLILLSRKWD